MWSFLSLATLSFLALFLSTKQSMLRVWTSRLEHWFHFSFLTNRALKFQPSASSNERQMIIPPSIASNELSIPCFWHSKLITNGWDPSHFIARESLNFKTKATTLNLHFDHPFGKFLYMKPSVCIVNLYCFSSFVCMALMAHKTLLENVCHNWRDFDILGYE